MKHFLCILSLFALIASGCAHETVGLNPPVADAAAPRGPGPLYAAGGNVVSDAGEGEDPYLDDDLDFLDEVEDVGPPTPDPLAPWNRAMFHVNDVLYFWAVRPVAAVYIGVTPELARTGVRNFFRNLGMPVRLVNCLLQGKSERAGEELGRFMVNSTLGFFGFGDPAFKHLDLNPPEEDLGQTLALYGVGDGFYLYWPLLGPSTLRDSGGMAGDYFLDILPNAMGMQGNAGFFIVKTVNSVALRIGEYETVKDAALEPYTALRNGYLEYRKTKIME
ncbi:MAG: VacJ family lipoprotein [Desulfobacterales bacterium]|nr:VacJ family lipoprotein [Desulfobacterales bacterium]